MKVERWGLEKADRLNEIVNHKSVYDWVCGSCVGPLDLANLLKDEAVLCFGGAYGCLIFNPMCTPALFSVHAQCLPGGRGAWMKEFTDDCVHILFCNTPCQEVMATVPIKNKACRALAQSVGFKKRWFAGNSWIYKHEFVDSYVYSLTVQDWLLRRDQLIEIGDRLVNTNELPDLSRHYGMLSEMNDGGQYTKGVYLYNRWAMASGKPVHLPVTVK